MLRYDKSELGESRHKEENYQRIGKRNEKCRHAIVYQRALLVAADMDFLCRVGTVTVYSESHKHYAAGYLQDEAVVVVVNQVHNEAHAEARYQRINEIAYRSPYACDKSVPTPLVQGTLYAEHPDRAHRSRCDDADKHPLENPVKYV